MSKGKISSDSTYFAKIYEDSEETSVESFVMPPFPEIEEGEREKKVIASREFVPDAMGEREKEFILGGFEFEYHGGYQVDRLLKKVEDEAEELLNGAKARVTDIEIEARDKGYNEGFEKGRAEGFKEVASLIASMGETMKSLTNARESFYDKSEREMIDLVVFTVGEVIEKEAMTDPTIISNVIKETLKQVTSAQVVTVKLNPVDLNLAKELRSELITEYENIKGVEFKEDPSIMPGGCYVETNIGMLDATIETKLLSIYKGLRQRVLI